MTAVGPDCRRVLHCGLSEKTIKIHRGQVMLKMQAGSLVELLHMADKLA